MSVLYIIFKVLSAYLSSPNSNFPGPFLKKLPLSQAGIVPLVVVGMGSGVSSTECTKGATLSSPLARGHRSLLDTSRTQIKKINDSTSENVWYSIEKIKKVSWLPQPSMVHPWRKIFLTCCASWYIKRCKVLWRWHLLEIFLPLECQSMKWD